MTAVSAIFLVDDNPQFRAGMQILLSTVASVRICGEASDGVAALPQILSLKPDIALVDLSMPVGDGAELIAQLRRHKATTKLIVLSQQNCVDWLRRILSNDIDAYILKSDGREFLLNAIAAVQTGEKYFSPSVAKTFYELLKQTQSPESGPASLNPLSPKEMQIAQLTARGLTVKEIATQLGCSENTIKTHRTNLMRKIEAHNAAEVSSWVHRSSHGSNSQTASR